MQSATAMEKWIMLILGSGLGQKQAKESEATHLSPHSQARLSALPAISYDRQKSKEIVAHSDAFASLCLMSDRGCHRWHRLPRWIELGRLNGWEIPE